MIHKMTKKVCCLLSISLLSVLGFTQVQNGTLTATVTNPSEVYGTNPNM
jgi:hypothetical protein